MAEYFKIKWESLGKEVRCKKIEHNQFMFDWFVDQLPVKSMQGHTLAAGFAIMHVSVPLNKPVNWVPRTEVNELFKQQKEGRVTMFMGNGTSAGILFKYGKITEDMSYPTFAEVVEEDMPILKEVGEAQWNAILYSKEIIIAEFCKVED